MSTIQTIPKEEMSRRKMYDHISVYNRTQEYDVYDSPNASYSDANRKQCLFR